MNKFQRTSIVLFWAVLGPVLAQDQDKPATGISGGLTLEQAQKEALEHSPEYRQALSRERETSWGQMEALSDGFLPHVSLGAQHFFNNELFSNTSYNYTDITVKFPGSLSYITFPGIYPNTTLTLGAQYDLFDGLKNIHKLDAANNQHEAARILADLSLLQLGEQVRLSYYEALAAKLLSDQADQKVKTLEDHLRIAQDQLDNGQATKYDVLRVQVQLSEAKSEQISQHDNVVLARESLTRTMGLQIDDRSLAGDLPVLDADSILKEVAQADLTNSPQLKAKHLQALAASDMSASANSFWFPRISLIGQYQWYQSPSYDGDFHYDNGNFQTDYFVGASATWDLLDGGLSFAKANEAGERAQQAGAEDKATQLQTPYDFDLWKRKLTSSASLYRAKLTDVETAKESARLATVGFKAGTRTTTDVLESELEEYRASAELVLAQLGALEALIHLELLTGKRFLHD